VPPYASDNMALSVISQWWKWAKDAMLCRINVMDAWQVSCTFHNWHS